MANGFNSATKRVAAVRAPGEGSKLGSRRIFAPMFKLQVLDSYRHDVDCKGNQRATARKYGIHRRQIQKWLQAEAALRGAAKGRISPALPLDCTTGRRSVSPPPHAACSPVDLSLKRPASPAPRDPAAWDLSWKPAALPVTASYEHLFHNNISRKYGYEVEAPVPLIPAPAPTPAPQQKPFKLFRPYLLDGEDDEPPSSAFERVVPSAGWQEQDVHPRSCYSVDFTIRSYYQEDEMRGNQRTTANIHRRQVQNWIKQEPALVS